ncbi:MAG TPA: methyltransferase domain-containing protein [Myxococcales bacterium]|nr:methyltransferase domain-containing protein [Myxococcales bacterium]
MVDLGAGTGDLAIPLASRGLSVTAVEPARRMLDVLERRAAEKGIAVQASPAVQESASVRATAPPERSALRAAPLDENASRATSAAPPERSALHAASLDEDVSRATSAATLDEGASRATSAAAHGHDNTLLTVHAAAEATGLGAASFDLAIVADALHWLDPELAGAEIARLLAPGGAFAIVEVELLPSSFSDALWPQLQAHNPKARPRALDLSGARTHLFSLATPGAERLAETFDCEHTLSPDAAAAVVGSLSFVGPALSPAALESLTRWAAEHARAGGAVWRRRLHLRWARRSRPRK